MQNLNQKEWIGVIVALCVVSFFFIVGPGIVQIFTNNTPTQMTTPQVEVTDTLVGGGEAAVTGTRVTVHYVGHFTDGKVFDSSVARNEPFQFLLGAGQVIQGWDDGLVGMREGGKRTLIIPSQLGYGPNDYGPIPGGSTLVFEIELIKVEK